MNTVKLVMSYGTLEASLISFEGELMELTLFHPSKYVSNVGDSMTCIYQGKYMESRLIRRKDEQLFVFVPAPARTLRDDRRNNQRSTTNLTGLLVNEDVHFIVKVTDIGHHGLSLISDDPSVQIHGEYHLAISSDKLSIVPHILIINQIYTNEGSRYGAKILFLQHESELQLKNYILNQLFMLSEAP